ncbi:MAG: hypothetical protein ABI240_14085 [Sphingomonas sp.]
MRIDGIAIKPLGVVIFCLAKIEQRQTAAMQFSQATITNICDRLVSAGSWRGIAASRTSGASS